MSLSKLGLQNHGHFQFYSVIMKKEMHAIKNKSSIKDTFQRLRYPKYIYRIAKNKSYT